MRRGSEREIRENHVKRKIDLVKNFYAKGNGVDR